MGLNEIKSFEDLLAFLPFLVRLFEQLDGLWEADLSKEDFAAAILNKHGKATYYGIKNDKEIVYFISVVKETETRSTFWLFYVNKDYREHTKNLLGMLKSELKSKKVETVRFTTSRLTRAYDRWVSKVGARKYLMTYTIDLSDESKS